MNRLVDNNLDKCPICGNEHFMQPTIQIKDLEYSGRVCKKCKGVYTHVDEHWNFLGFLTTDEFKQMLSKVNPVIKAKVSHSFVEN